MKYNIWNKWGKLNSVVLGDIYRPEFFDPIKDAKVRASLQWLAEETLEDLDYYERVLKDFGCEIFRPDIDNYDLNDYLDEHSHPRQKKNLLGIPKPPLQPRDNFMVMGNTGFVTGTDHNSLHRLLDNDFKDWRPKGSNIHAPSYTLVGRDLFVNTKLQKNSKWFLHEHQEADLREALPGIRIHKIDLEGHADGSFHTVAEGMIISLKDTMKYTNTFPGWEVEYLPDQGNVWAEKNLKDWKQIKKQVKGKWWIPGEESNDKLTSFINEWLTDWVGYIEETVFDVNVLMLDEKHCCVINEGNEQVNTFMKKCGIEIVPVPWRHRYFWDGGLHCITLDLNRDGQMEDYWPAGRVEINEHEVC